MDNSVPFGKMQLFNGRRNATVRSSVEVSKLKPQSTQEEPSSEYQTQMQPDYATDVEYASVAQATIRSAQPIAQDPDHASEIAPSTDIAHRLEDNIDPNDQDLYRANIEELSDDCNDEITSTSRLKQKILTRKRQEFEIKAKKKESSSFYISKKDSNEKILHKSTDIQRDLDMLKLEKELYSTIAKYGKDIPKHWDGKLLNFDSSMGITLQNLLEREVLQDEAHQFAQEFYDMLQERMRLRQQIKKYKEEDETQLSRYYPHNMKNQSNEANSVNRTKEEKKIYSNSFNQKSNNNRIDYFTDQRSQKSLKSEKNKIIAIGKGFGNSSVEKGSKKHLDKWKATDKRNIFKQIGKVQSFSAQTKNEKKRTERLNNEFSAFRFNL